MARTATPLGDVIATRADDEESLGAAISYEGKLGTRAKCIATCKRVVHALSVSVPLRSGEKATFFPVARAAVQEWLESLPRGSHMDRLEAEFSKADSAAKAAQRRTTEEARRARETADQRQRAAAAKERRHREREAFLKEKEKRDEALAGSIERARRELADHETRERIMARRFDAKAAATIRMWLTTPGAAADAELSECVATAFAARCFASDKQRQFVHRRTLEIRDAALLGAGPKCVRCGGPTRIRRGKIGPFWGCARYPRCQWTRDAHKDVELAKAKAVVRAEKEAQAS